MEKSSNQFEFGLFFWQVFVFIITITICYFLLKLGSKLLKYYIKKQ